ncbi:hypothetical protein [Mesorhizobium cantuariense]|uniref:Uncharacterized protein n=1 Tax=Mesorhizobium cantuariense TaxID=1300275 RepID=A0ABV7MRF5_9HYPH
MAVVLPINACPITAAKTHRCRTSPGVATILFVLATLVTGVADEEDDYADCLINTAIKIMRTQIVKDPAKALDEASKRCKAPPRVT